MLHFFQNKSKDKINLQGKIFTFTAYIISGVSLLLLIKQFIISNTFFSKILDLGGIIFPLILLYLFRVNKKSQVLLSQLLLLFLITLNTLSALKNGGLIPGTVLIYLGFFILTLFSLPPKNIIFTATITWACLAYVIFSEYREPEIRMPMNTSIELLTNNTIMAVIMVAIFLSLIIIKNGYDLEHKLNREQAIKLNEQREKLELADRFKSRLVAIISHDVRSPINNLQSMVDLVNQEIITPEQFQKFLPDINQKIASTSQAINNILQWSSLTMKQDAIVKKEVIIHPIIEEEIQKIALQFGEKELSFFNQVSGVLSIQADPELYKAILRNLLNNAAKFSPPHGSIHVNHYEKDDYHVFSVTDNGVGMSKTFLQNLFKGEIISSPGTKGEKGTGVGLMLCKDFIEYHNGCIWADSQPEAGSTFYFSFPK